LKSGAPPAPEDTMKRIGRSGYAAEVAVAFERTAQIIATNIVLKCASIV
jgi:hypothetical protein